MLVRATPCILMMLSALLIGGCAETVPADRPLKPLRELIQGYDKTLTKQEQKQAIEELRSEAKRKGQAAGEAAAAPDQSAETRQ